MYFKNIIKKSIYFITLLFIFKMNTNITYCTILPSSSLWTKSTISDTFPESYNSLIDNLKKIHSKWIFKAVYTHLDWDTVMTHQSNKYLSGINTIHDSYSSNWKYNGRNEYADGSYVKASNAAIAYTLDPRNSLTDERIFQFEYMGFSSSIHTESAVQAVLSGTLMGEAKKSEYKVYGNRWVNLGTTYAKLIQSIGKSQGISPVHMASRIRQETSCDLANNGSINGQHVTYKSTYNFFNIKAIPDANGNNSVTNGLKYAYSQGWTNPNNAISGGTSTIIKYINNDQNTIYFEKFPTNNEGKATKLLGTGYMTNIMAPINESKTTYNAYKNTGILESAFEFHIPVYNNMPDICPNPNLISQYKDDNSRIYLKGSSDNSYYLKNSDGVNILKITESSLNMQSTTPSYVIYRKRNYTYNPSDYMEVYVVNTGKTYYGFIEKKYINVFSKDYLDTTPPIIDIEYKYDANENTVTATINSNELLRDTKLTWKLSNDKKSYTKKFTKNETYITPVTDLSKNTTNVTINITDIDDKPPIITFNYKLNEDNTVTVTAKSNEDLMYSKPTWSLSEDKKTYTKSFDKNQNYSTSFKDIYGNSVNCNINFNLIKMNVDITYDYNESNNTVNVIIFSEKGFKATKPTWILSSDKKTYTKLFKENISYSTLFYDLSDNFDMVDLNIDSIDDTPPIIEFTYNLNEDNTVTVSAKSNEPLKENKPTWQIYEDHTIYQKTFYSNQNYKTNFSDIYGNTKEYRIFFDNIKIRYEMEYIFDKENNIVTVKVTSSVPLAKIKPTWSYSQDNRVIIKTFNKNQNYTTPITDIYGNTEIITINFDDIK